MLSKFLKKYSILHVVCRDEDWDIIIDDDIIESTESYHTMGLSEQEAHQALFIRETQDISIAP